MKDRVLRGKLGTSQLTMKKCSQVEILRKEFSEPPTGSENSFSEYFDLRTLLHYLHFIQVTNPFITSQLNDYFFLSISPNLVPRAFSLGQRKGPGNEVASAPVTLRQNSGYCEIKYSCLGYYIIVI